MEVRILLRPIPLSATGFCFSFGFGILLAVLNMMGIENVLVINGLLALTILFLAVGILGLVSHGQTWIARRRLGAHRQPSAAEKCRVLKTSLGNALAEGRKLQRFMYFEGGELRIHSQQEWDDWLERTYNLIEHGIDKGKVERFRGKRGDRIENRLQRLDELISRITPADVNPDFDPQE